MLQGDGEGFYMFIDRDFQGEKEQIAAEAGED
ncbi:MAG: hypothetical protein QOE70_4717 [Chthoniobacter sp.]|jgi:hypothetical protein|nr:hypothetical protein [Chthoniobacter sp.]